MDRYTQVDRIAQRYVDANRFSNIEWHVERDGTTLTRGNVGYADALNKVPVPEQALYRIYSMTKPIVTAVALILIERGQLRLYDPLAKYDRRFGQMRVLQPDGQLLPAARLITVEDLMTHRAGFTYEFITGCHIAPLYERQRISGDGECDFDEMMDRLSRLPLASHPGDRFRYSVATDVLGWVCEKASGQTLDELVQQLILDPLEMVDTAYHVPESKQARLMPMFGIADLSEFLPLNPVEQTLKPARVERMYPSDKPGVFRRGGHGLFSTLNDYSKFARMLLDGKTADGATVLSRKTLELMRTNRLPAAQRPVRVGMLALPGFGFGLGVRVLVDPGQTMNLGSVGEFGWSGAASTYFWVDPVERVSGVFMTQYLGSTLPLAEDLRTAVYQQLD